MKPNLTVSCWIGGELDITCSFYHNTKAQKEKSGSLYYMKIENDYLPELALIFLS